MLYGVHWPATLAVAEGVDSIAAECGRIEDLSPRLVVFRVFEHDSDILHKRFYGALHEGVVHHYVLSAEILLHNMVDAVRDTRKCLSYRQCECVCRVDERHGREDQVGEVGQFVIGVGA